MSEEEKEYQITLKQSDLDRITQSLERCIKYLDNYEEEEIALENLCDFPENQRLQQAAVLR